VKVHKIKQEQKFCKINPVLKHVRLIKVSNDRNDHESQVYGVRVHLTEVSVEYRYFFTVNVGKDREMGLSLLSA